VKADKKLKLVVYDALGYQGITFNLAHGARAQTPVGQQAVVRQAFALAIDRTALVQVVYNGMFTPVAQAIPAASPFYDPAIVPVPRDAAKARAMLLAAGVKLPVTLELTTTNSPTQQQEAEVIQSMAAEAGFDVKVRATEFSASLDADDRGDFTAHLFGWSGRSDPDGNTWNFIHSGAPLNIGQYANKDVDGWLEQARAVTDIAARRALYGRVSAQVIKDVPLMYLYTTKAITAMNVGISGFRQVPDAIIRLQGMSMTK
jgi:peptide/nickel transport system substrate-binding protein